MSGFKKRVALPPSGNRYQNYTEDSKNYCWWDGCTGCANQENPYRQCHTDNSRN